MELVLLLAIVLLALVFLLWRGRRGGSGRAYHVAGEEHLQADLAADEANLRAAQYPGPGGPMEGGGGTNATFGS